MAIRISAQERQVLVASIYIPCIGIDGAEANREQLRERLQAIQQAIDQERTQDPSVELIIAGDFNRHDILWGGNHIGNTRRQGEAQQILDFMEMNDLQSMLPRGSITFESRAGESTIDLMLVSQRLAEEKSICALYGTEHGSDHRAIHSAFSMDTANEESVPTVRYMIKQADWTKVRGYIEQHPSRQRFSTLGLDEMEERLVGMVQGALEEHCPKVKPSVYSKRWWNVNLSELRKNYTSIRNKARSRRRQGRMDLEMEATAKQARQEFHHAIKKRKKEHWTEFLDDTKNIWAAAKYLDPDTASGFGKISYITGQDGTKIQDKEKIAGELLSTFFPPPPIPQQSETDTHDWERLRSASLCKDEIERALFEAHPDKAPGQDQIPTRVWREVWPVLQDQIFMLFNKSIKNGQLPKKWKVAKIVPLRKGGKDDYTVAKSYRPISLLATLGKILELIIAKRITYLAETSGLLPKNHFGARKQRSTVHALSYLQDKILTAWRGRKTLSLVSFDVKGAYNNVASGPLLNRLMKRGIPTDLIMWIRDFCKDREACVTVNGHTSKIQQLPQSGLPQGSPLSPILFLFFNADLVQKRYRKGGSMAFVDDYTAWIVGDSAEENTRLIQNDILPVLETWEKESGAIFESSKTAFIHFTRNKGQERDSDKPLTFKGEEIAPQQEVKLLGLIMDKELRFRTHVAAKAAKAFKAALALKRLKGLRPSSIRQLFSATVAPVMDYASPIWSQMIPEKCLGLLEPAQRTAAQAIICSFKTVSIIIAEAEAGIKAIRQRLLDQMLNFWISIQKLDDTHPHAKLAKRQEGKRFCSPIGKAAEMFKNISATKMQRIPTILCSPWGLKPRVFIKDKEDAIRETIPKSGRLDVYTDGSIRNGKAGLGIWSRKFKLSQTTVRAEETSIHLTELQAILLATKKPIIARDGMAEMRIFTDSKVALQNILKPKRNDCQSMVAEIRKVLVTKFVSIHWIPGHCKVYGNEKAHELAQQATEANIPRPGKARTLPMTIIYGAAAKAGFKPEVDSFARSKAGYYTKKMDKALPGKHTRELYNKLKKTEAAILSQLRTGACRLNCYLQKIGVTESDRCECGQKETVPHFLFMCQQWKEQRRDMRRIHATRYGSISFALGGYSTHEIAGVRTDGRVEEWKPNQEAVRATIDFAIATRRLDYTP